MVEIFFRNLRKKTQKKLLKEFNISSPEEMNWDIFPLVSFNPTDISDISRTEYDAVDEDG